jgi:NAD(P)-dependent dehydrogenase (short-subunit alcohol dehydrogenase family)
MAKIALFTLCYAAHVSAFPLAPREMTKPTTMHALSKKSTAEEVASMYAKDSLAGKVAVVTGGNSGIGLETCKVLAERGCKVVLCSRSREAGEAAIASLPPTQGSVVVAQLDLADLTRVDTAATEIETLLVDHKKIDFLVLNAGIMATPTLEYTPQGFEMQVGTNHFGHFRLTQKLW